MRLRYVFPCLLSLPLAVAIGCAGSAPSIIPGPKPVLTASLISSPASVLAGSNAKLTWQTSNATSVSITPGIGAVAANGSVDVTPATTTTYTLTASNGSSSMTSTATVTVTSLPAPSTANLSLSPASIQAGQSTTLMWATTNATSVTIDQGIGGVAASGSKVISPAQTTTYTLTAVGGGHTATSTATVVVTAPPVAPTANLSSSAATIQTGQSATLTWTTTNATSVTIDQGIGSVAASGSKVVSPTQTTTYTLTAVGGGHTVTSTVKVTVTASQVLTGVLKWKGGTKGIGNYNTETALTPNNVNPTQFGRVRNMPTDGEVLAQPLYVRDVDLGAGGIHDLLIVANEHDSVYAYDGKSNSTTPLWRRNFLDPANGITTQADDHGGRSTFGGEIGITGTPIVDPATGILYVVAATEKNGTVTDTLHALDIRTGNDAAGGSVAINATYPGTGEGSVNGQIPFAPAQENQRPGLAISKGVLYVAFGSFSDTPPYHGWLFAYDPKTLQQLGVFNSSPTYRADYDHGSSAAFWNGGAAPSFEDDGTFFIVAADGSTDVENGGVDYGDTVLHMSFANGQFKVLDWFTPFNRDCIDYADLEMGSGGVALLPPEVGGGSNLGVALTKEGRLYLLDRANLGHFNANGDQVVQQFMVGADICDASSNESDAEGPVWERLYGNASYWNGNLYMAASNATVRQYSINNGAINPQPVAMGASNTGPRGANTVVSSNGSNDGIVWALEKTYAGLSILHAYDATNIGREIWNSNMNSNRDGLNTGGEAFQVPVVIDGKVIVTSGVYVDVYSLLP